MISKGKLLEKTFKIYIIFTVIFLSIIFNRDYILPYSFTLLTFYVSSIFLLFLNIDFKIFLLTLPLSFFLVSIFFRTHIFPEVLIVSFNRTFYVLIFLIMRRFKFEIPKIVKIVYINVIILFFTLEFVLNIFYIVKPLDILKRKDELLKLKPYTYFNGEFVNRFGFLGMDLDKPKEKKRILFVGDSFCVGVVDYRYNFIKMFEDSLDCEVVNLSQPGFSPKDYLKLLEEYFEMVNPDLTFVVIFSGNDVTEIYYPENNYSFFNLKIVNLLQNLSYISKMESREGDLSEKNFFEVEKRRASFILKNEKNEGWEFFEKQLVKIKKFFEDRNKKVIFLIIPDQFSVDRDLQKELFENNVKPKIGWDYVDRRIEKFLDGNNCLTYSLVDTFKILYDNGEKLYREKNTHLNEKGNYIVFKFLENKIKKEYL